MSHYLSAAERVHRYLMGAHWDGGALVGPDPGVRFNYRVGRFVKGYLPRLPWRDDYYYLQGQGYWILAGWALYARDGRNQCREVALRCSETMLRRQRPDGAWEYPNVEWKGRVATAEGTWGSLGLLESYRQTGDGALLEGALRWYGYVLEQIGFQQVGGELAVNYFAGVRRARIVNNSAFLLRFLAELAAVTGDAAFLRHCDGLMAFMRGAQRPSGELPYGAAGVNGEPPRPHYQCYQYNAFQCLDLIRYHELTGDVAARPLIAGVLRFLAGGLEPDGHVAYACASRRRAITYHAAAVGAALYAGSRLEGAGLVPLADRAYGYVLAQQRADGSFPHSRGEYRLLSDRRSYPRYQAMILYQLLLRESLEEQSHRKEGAHARVR